MMCLYLFYIICSVFQTLDIYSVSAKRQPLQRFLLEEGAKQPIFGSYNYDPIRQVFDIIPDENNTQQNGSYIYTTVYPEHDGPMDAGENGTLVSQRYFIFRKNVETTSKTSVKKINDKNVTGQNKAAENLNSKKLETNELEQRSKKPNMALFK